MILSRSVALPLEVESTLNKVAKVENVFPIALIAFLVLPFFLIPSFFAIVIYLVIALLADIAYRPKSRILSSLLLPIVGSGIAFGLNSLNLGLPTKNLEFCTLVALISLLFFNNKINVKDNRNQKTDLLNFAKISILPVGLLSLSFAMRGTSLLNNFMGGDSRNTSLAVKNIFENGYITPEQQSNYPSNFLFLNATVVEALQGSSTIHRYLISLFVVFVFCIMLILLSLGRLSDFLNLGSYRRLILSLFVLTPPVLGFVVANGFWTALWAMVILTGLFTNLLIYFEEKVVPPRSFLLIFLLLSYHAWALLTPLVILISLYCEYLRIVRKGWSLDLRGLIGPFMLSSYTLLTVAHNSSAVPTPLEIVTKDGGIQNLSITFLLLLFLLSFYLVRDYPQYTVIYWIVGFFLSVSFLTIGWLRLPNTFAGYYNVKLFWIVYFSFIPILLVLFFKKVSPDQVRFPNLYILSVFLLTANLSGLSLSTSQSILVDNDGIKSETVQVLSDLKDDTPAIFWQFDDPPKDRVGTFWSSFLSNKASDQTTFNQIAVWAYSQTGREEDLCNIVRLEPGVTIFTRYPGSVKEVLTRMCPEVALNVIVR